MKLSGKILTLLITLLLGGSLAREGLRNLRAYTFFSRGMSLLQSPASEADLKTAEACFKRAISLDSSVSAFYHYLGSCLRRQDRTEDAVTAYKRAVALNPLNGVYRYRLGLFQLEKGMLTEAAYSFRLASRTEPHYPRLCFVAGRGLLEVARRSKSPRHLHEAFEAFKLASVGNRAYLRRAADTMLDRGIDPGNLRYIVQDTEAGHRTLGRVLARKGFQEEALEEYRLALSKAPGSPEILLAMGELLLALGSPEEAARRLQEAFERFRKTGNIAAAARRVEMAYERSRRFEEGVAFFRWLLEKYPEQQGVIHLAMGKLFFRWGERYKALECLERAAKLGQKEAYGHLYRIAMDWKDYTSAEVYARESIRQYPFRPEHRLALAKVLEAQKEYGKSAEAVEQALELAPGNRGYKDLLARLRKLARKSKKKPAK
jgi:tetratricopeptide (TPR) repeat protein